MPLKPSRLRLILRILVALLLTLSAMSAGVFWLLQRNPQALAEHYIEQIDQSVPECGLFLADLRALHK